MLKIIIIGIVVTVVGLFALSAVKKVTTNDNTSLNGYPTTEVVDEEDVKVVISGEINHPGSYYISQEETLGDLITMAGGVTTNADETCYEVSLQIGDRTSFYIPSLSSASGVCVDTTTSKVNINIAEIVDLEGVGFNSSQASNVYDYRINTSEYYAIEDILKVKGVGQATFEKVKNKISIK